MRNTNCALILLLHASLGEVLADGINGNLYHWPVNVAHMLKDAQVTTAHSSVSTTLTTTVESTITTSITPSATEATTTTAITDTPVTTTTTKTMTTTTGTTSRTTTVITTMTTMTTTTTTTSTSTTTITIITSTTTMTTTTTTTTTTSLGDCDPSKDVSNQFYNGGGAFDSWFMRSPEAMRYREAKIFCQSKGGSHLAYVRTKNEYGAVKHFFESSGHDNFWIGLEVSEADASCHGIDECESTGKLQWSNGESYQGGPDLTYGITIDQDGVTKCTYANNPYRIATFIQNPSLPGGYDGCELETYHALCQYEC